MTCAEYLPVAHRVLESNVGKANWHNISISLVDPEQVFWVRLISSGMTSPIPSSFRTALQGYNASNAVPATRLMFGSANNSSMTLGGPVQNRGCLAISSTRILHFNFRQAPNERVIVDKSRLHSPTGDQNSFLLAHLCIDWFVSLALIKSGMYVCLAHRNMTPSNSLSGGIQKDIGKARNRNGNEQVRPQFESASPNRY
jgi:hypothetical protein